MALNVRSLKSKIAAVAPKAAVRDPRTLARVILGILLLANIVAAIVAFRPWEASPEELERQMTDLRKQGIQRRGQIDRLKVLVTKSEKAVKEGDQFMGKYFLGRRTASSTLVNELHTMAKSTGIKPKEHAFVFEPIEGSEDLAMMTITGNYEGSYADLIQYVNRIDRSPRFFILESLSASPQQGNPGVLNINMKVNVFVRDEVPLPPEVSRSPAQSAALGPPSGDRP